MSSVPQPILRATHSTGISTTLNPTGLNRAPSILTTLSETLAAMFQPVIPPQVIVEYNGRTKAYGRDLLKGLGYNGARTRIFKDFKIAPRSENDRGAKDAPVAMFGRFYKRHRSGDEAPVVLDSESWCELVSNVARIEMSGKKAGWDVSNILFTVLVFIVVFCLCRMWF